MKLKQIIIDKDIFQGTSTSELVNFVHNHFLILPEVLYFECLTTTEKRKILLERFKAIVLSGGYVCPYYIDIVQTEAKALAPFAFLVDLGKVSDYKSAFRKNSKLCSNSDVEAAHENQLDLSKTLINIANALSKNTTKEEPEFVSKIRKIRSDKKVLFKRYRLFAEEVDSEIDIHQFAKRLWPTITDRFEKFCISNEWFSWHFTRLLSIYCCELWRLIQSSGQIGIKKVEHDVQDIGYVSLLCLADALLTEDKGCKALAQAAFPEKDVFSSLDEVPNEYLCHWG